LARFALWIIVFSTVMWGPCASEIFAFKSFQSLQAFIGEFIRSSKTQWALTGFFFIYSVMFAIASLMFLGWKSRISSARVWTTALFIAFASAGYLHYCHDYKQAVQTQQALIFFVGIAAAMAVVCCNSRVECPTAFTQAIPLLALETVLTISSIISVSEGSGSRPAYYHGHLRWGGLWGYANIAGALMGVGVIVAVGLAAQTFSSVFSFPGGAGSGSYQHGVGAGTEL
jgi:hypothetical protein